MLRRLTLRDFVIVPALELDFQPGFTVLTGETGAGKSILIDALQLALGSRADAVVVREGCPRAEVSAEFDPPQSLAAWLDAAGFASDDTLLLRRTVDAQGKSRAWINGSPSTVAQLREAADLLLDIHGQHAWQSLTRPASVRALLDQQACIDSTALQAAYTDLKAAADKLVHAQQRQGDIERERDRLAWQISELEKLAPNDGEWAELSAEQQRLAHAQALIDAARQALTLVAEAEDANAENLTSQALDALSDVLAHDPRLREVADALHGALAQLQDATHTLNSYLGHVEPDPRRLAELDVRMSAWLGFARRWRHPAQDLPQLLSAWRADLAALEASTNLPALEAALTAADTVYRAEARRVTQGRQRAAKPLAQAVTQAMQHLGMAGGRFEVQLHPLTEPQAHGLEAVEFLVAGHAGSTPRPLSKVASGGELSRLALAIAVNAVRSGSGAATLIFDEIDVGIGGAVGDTVGALMKQLGQGATGQAHQVLAVTHLAQVAACADHHLVVAKTTQPDGRTSSTVQPVVGEARVAEVARMLGGERMVGTSLAHAQAMLQARPPGSEPALLASGLPPHAAATAKPLSRKRSKA